MNWDGHRYLALLASNCWCRKQSASELGWDHHDDSVLCDRPICRQLWEYSVYPDRKDVWSECKSKIKTSWYMTPNCPPPPPWHHEKRILLAVEYYLTLARQSVARYAETENDQHLLEAGKYFGIATHFIGDFVINPYWLKDSGGELSVYWDYEDRAEPISNAVLKIDPARPFVEEVNKLKFPTPYDYLRQRLWEARLDSIRGEYDKVSWTAVIVAKTLYNAVFRGWYEPDESFTLKFMGLNLLTFLFGLVRYGESGNPAFLALAEAGALASAPALSFFKYGKRLWEEPVLDPA